MKELTINAAVENLDTVLAFVSGELEAGGCDGKTQMNIGIAVEEIFVNIAYYAYNAETGGAAIRVAIGSEIVIEFEDNGKPFNPLEKNDPNISSGPVGQREIGGLGIFMVKQIMDSVTYKHVDNKNILTIRKRLTP